MVDITEVQVVKQTDPGVRQVSVHDYKTTILLGGETTFRYIDLKLCTFGKRLTGNLHVTFTIPGEHLIDFHVDVSTIEDYKNLRFDLRKEVTSDKISIHSDEAIHTGDHLYYSADRAGQVVYKLLSGGTGVDEGPLISIITGTYKTPPEILRSTIASVVGQKYKNWEWIIVDDGSQDAELTSLLAEASQHPNIISVVATENGGISKAQNKALEYIKGEWFVVLDHDDTLTEDALFEIAKVIKEDPDVELIYSDEDKIPERPGPAYNPFYKPDWSPMLLLCQNYICHLTAFKTSIFQEKCPEGYESEFDGSQDYRVLLKYTHGIKNVHHIPAILYHWRATSTSEASKSGVKPQAASRARQAIDEAILQQGAKGFTLGTEHPGLHRPHFCIRGSYPSVSIIIPTKGPGIIETCLETLLKTSYDQTAITLVDNGSDLKEVKPIYDKYKSKCLDKSNPLGCSDLSIIYGVYDFNFSTQVNRGVAATFSDYILLLNNDTEVINPEWLQRMASILHNFPDVAVVGARLLYPNGLVQHAGVAMGIGGVAGHISRGAALNNAGYFGNIQTIHEVSAVTGACMLIRRSVFDRVGGFDETLPRAFNDIDFCMKVRKEGHRIIYQPDAILYHHESASRGIDSGSDPIFQQAINHMLINWKSEIASDPYFHPMFSRRSEQHVF